MKPRELSQVIGRKRYSTETAILISGDDYFDGRNYERNGRNTFLYRTPKGSYFAAHLTGCQGENNYLQALSEEEAITLFESHMQTGNIRIDFDKAFPGIEVEEA